MAKSDRGTHTDMPWLTWTQFKIATLESCCGHSVHKRTSATSVDKWSAERFGGKLAPGYGKAFWGGQYFGEDNEKGWFPICIPQGDLWDRMSDDLIMPWSIGIYFTVAETEGCEYDTMVGMSCRIGVHSPFLTTGWGIEDYDIDWGLVSGKYYDGVNEWDTYPTGYAAEADGVQKPGEYGQLQCLFSEMPAQEYMSWTCAWHTGYGGCKTINARESFFKHGLLWEVINYDPGLDSNDYVKMVWMPNRVKMYFINPIVNSLNKYKFKAGETVVMNGLAFEIPGGTLGDYALNPGGNYSHALYEAWVESIDGQHTYTISPGDVATGIESNTRASFPLPSSMEPGFYWIKLRGRQMEQPADELLMYAGDYRTIASGQAYKGDRIVIQVGEVNIPPSPPVPYWKWKWKWGDLEIWEYYAPIDVRSDEIFWEGRVMSVSSVTRSLDDTYGLYNISDMDVELANTDMHFSSLLANYHCKGCAAALTHGWGTEPAAWHDSVFVGIVDDYSFQGPAFRAKLKDVSQKYFKRQLPRYVITSEDFPNAPNESLGRAFPELLGLHSLTEGDAPGAIEAICVDETTYKYALAGGPLKELTNVYSDGALIGSSNWTETWDEYGRAFLTFDSDQGNNKITFNCKGYVFEEWNSDNGYVQNPAYILAFYLSLLLDVPINFLDMGTFDELAQLYEDSGWHESGRLAITAKENADSIFQSLLYSFGAKYWLAHDGRFSVGRKDISNLTSDLFFHAQLDLKEHPQRLYNFDQAVNSVKAVWDFYPASDTYKGASEQKDHPSIDQFESELGPDQPWEFRWITDDTFAAQRITEDLLKLAYGNKEVTFTISMEWIGQIDIFDNFRLQDPYGLSSTGSGESGRWYYITALTYDYTNKTIGVTAVDLSWLLQQYFIFGDENEMPQYFTDAGDLYRLYGYCCDEVTDKFSDGTQGKRLIDENYIDQ
jgi:hypothetical protein